MYCATCSACQSIASNFSLNTAVWSFYSSRSAVQQVASFFSVCAAQGQTTYSITLAFPLSLPFLFLLLSVLTI